MVLRSSSMIYPWHLSSYCVSTISSESREESLTCFSSYWKNDKKKKKIHFPDEMFLSMHFGSEIFSKMLVSQEYSKNWTLNPFQGLVYITDLLSPKILVKITKIILFCTIITFLFQAMLLSPIIPLLILLQSISFPSYPHRTL